MQALCTNLFNFNEAVWACILPDLKKLGEIDGCWRRQSFRSWAGPLPTTAHFGAPPFRGCFRASFGSYSDQPQENCSGVGLEGDERWAHQDPAAENRLLRGLDERAAAWLMFKEGQSLLSRAFPVSPLLDSGGVCSMGPDLVYGIMGL